MRAKSALLNDSGWFTPGQICERNPAITKVTGWTPVEIGKLAAMGVFPARESNQRKYIPESEVMELVTFIQNRRA